MEISFDNNQPIYWQIMAHFKKKLASGMLMPGARVPSVRELALDYGVNPNTMQKALAELERAGYLISERTAGRSVTRDEPLIVQLKKEEIGAAVRCFVNEMTALGVPVDDLPSLLTEYIREIGVKN